LVGNDSSDFGYQLPRKEFFLRPLPPIAIATVFVESITDRGIIFIPNASTDTGGNPLCDNSNDFINLSKNVKKTR
jgi:hypothetical protein